MDRQSSSMAASASNLANTTPETVFPCCLPGKVRGNAIGTIRSYDHQGVPFSWQPPPSLAFERAAIDVEAKNNPSSRYISAKFGLADDVFLRRWTATEALAKVLDQPVLDFVKMNGLSPEAGSYWARHSMGPWLLRIDHPTHWVTVAAIL
jgi:hypothetical protein